MNLPYELPRFFWRVIDYIYPPVCAGCGEQNHRFCPTCFEQLQLITTPFCAFCGKSIKNSKIVCPQCANMPVYFDGVSAWGKYEGVLREAIHALKYKSDLGLGDLFAGHLIPLILRKEWNFDIVIPVPISKTRFKERSYNQSALLSRPIARYFKTEHSTKYLTRVKDTGSQIHRTKNERNEALEDAFLANPAKLKDRSVLLVDDIITTGATINHCSAALRKAGAKAVFAVSIAKTFPHLPDKERLKVL